MATKRAFQAPQIEEKIWTVPKIEQGVAKIRRRISDVGNLNAGEIGPNDAKVETAQNSIRDTVREVFGLNSQEARDLHSPSLYWSDGTMGNWDEEPNYLFHYSRGISHMITSLEGLISKLEEKRLDLAEDPTGQAALLFEGMKLHPRIATVTAELYRNGHYSEAIFSASKALNNFVQERSGKYDLDGSNLMTTVFNKNSPILVFNSLNDQSDLDEQQGMMHLFQGAVLGVRNPRGHSFLDDSPEEALEFIGFLSLLANRVEKARLMP
jgi:uncharacterized protein (TIGR02391 family)